MSDLQWTVSELQQMLAERNATECDASKRDAEHALCRIANESLVHDLTWVMDERDRLQAEVQRLQAELTTTHRTWAERCSAWSDGMEAAEAERDAAHRAGQEAMLYAVKKVCAELMGGYEDWRGLAEDGSDYWRAEGCLLAMEDLVHKLPTVGEKK